MLGWHPAPPDEPEAETLGWALAAEAIARRVIADGTHQGALAALADAFGGK